ncbi:MAG: 6-phosphofructokinase [Clostridia bacterium]|nr:6-phosphofructokinase [Clostridia bacterium]
MNRILVLTSGGDAPGMNAAVRAVVRRALYAGLEVWGARRGYWGLVNWDVLPMDASSVADIVHRGGTILHTGRCEPFLQPDVQTRVAERLRREGVDGVVVIGGDGSLRGALALEARGVPAVGVPGTIDNDLHGTERTIGFDSAINTVVQAIDKIRDTATAHERTFVVEVMGRHAGFIALHAGLADGAESIILPEVGFDANSVVERLRRGRERGKLYSIIVVAEGAASGYDVARRLAEFGIEARVTVLGHVQRGGSPSAYDRWLAARLGAAAVDALVAGRHRVMVGVRGETVVETPLEEVVAGRPAIDRSIWELAQVLSS